MLDLSFCLPRFFVGGVKCCSGYESADEKQQGGFKVVPYGAINKPINDPYKHALGNFRFKCIDFAVEFFDEVCGIDNAWYSKCDVNVKHYAVRRVESV